MLKSEKNEFVMHSVMREAQAELDMVGSARNQPPEVDNVFVGIPVEVKELETDSGFSRIASNAFFALP